MLIDMVRLDQELQVIRSNSSYLLLHRLMIMTMTFPMVMTQVAWNQIRSVMADSLLKNKNSMPSLKAPRMSVTLGLGCATMAIDMATLDLDKADMRELKKKTTHLLMNLETRLTKFIMMAKGITEIEKRKGRMIETVSGCRLVAPILD